MIMLPPDCWIFSHIMEISTKMLMPTAICEYWIAKVETASLAPNAPTNTPDNPQPRMKNAIPPTTESATPCSAAKSAASCLLSPRRRAMSEFTPTPVPTPIATTSIWSG